ncbi:AraC family transcriptional regulator [Nocardia abscessus]|uniref:AraC family transcriptional regulator n=1 Tax=Nocardia abscessus TaxID=120957 RepID=A0ABS0CFZ5_9NOCA|nr:AraC family transcriptional regulator [Nocardia abscessus]MBF6229264.1 AraC family transcriptional regulator [Nocardia abscessus]
MTDPEYRQVPFDMRQDESKADRAARWHDWLHTWQGTVGLAFHDDDFSSSALGQSVGEFHIVGFESGALTYQRSRRDVRGDGDYGYRLLIPLEGSFKLAQGDSKEIFRPGKICLFHWGSPVYMTHDETIRALIMTVPEKSIRLLRPGDAPLALDETRPVVRALDKVVRQLADSREQWTTADFTYTFSSALTLLEGGLTPNRAVTLTGTEKEIERAKDAQRARILIEQKASDPTVTPEGIAEMCGMSLKTLHTVLKATEGRTPGAMLRKVRLDLARQRLSTPLPIDMDRIASEVGFTTTRRFREAFQRQFGQTPAQLREELFGIGTKG